MLFWIGCSDFWGVEQADAMDEEVFVVASAGE